MQPIPIDTESFVKMRTAKEPMLYVDKTAYLHRLVADSQSSNFFLARPRRFGKSLMISTLEAIFLGQRELFKGLAIDKPAALATTQAERQHYAAPYLAAGKPVWIIGLSFDSKTRELIDHCVECFA